MCGFEYMFNDVVILWSPLKYSKMLSCCFSYLLSFLKLYLTLQPSRKRWRKRMTKRRKSWRSLSQRWKIWLILSAVHMGSHHCLRTIPPSLCHLSKRSKCFWMPWMLCTAWRMFSSIYSVHEDGLCMMCDLKLRMLTLCLCVLSFEDLLKRWSHALESMKYLPASSSFCWRYCFWKVLPVSLWWEPPTWLRIFAESRIRVQSFL